VKSRNRASWIVLAEAPCISVTTEIVRILIDQKGNSRDAVDRVLTFDLLLWIVAKTRYIDSSAPRLLTIIPAGMVMFVVDLIALRWVALWLALTSKNLSQAMGGAWVRILGLPWLIYLGLYWSWTLLFQFAGRPGPDLTLQAWTICWLTIGLLFDAVFGLQARRGFLMEFRALASERSDSRKSDAVRPAARNLLRGALNSLTRIISPSRGAHAPPRVPSGAPAGRPSHSNDLQTADQPAASLAQTRAPRAFPGFASRRHALAGALIGAALLGASWFGWYRWSLSRQIKVHFAAIQKAGEPVTEADLLKWHPPIPGEENAASVVERAALALFSTQWLPKPAQDLVRSLPTAGPSLRAERLSEECREVLAGFISSNQTALRVVHEVPRYPKSRYDSVWNRTQNPVWSWWVPTLRGAHELMHVLRIEALLQIDENQPGPALRSLNALLAVSRTLAQEPLLGPRGLQNTGLNSAASLLECLLTRHALSDGELRELSARFNLLQTSNRLARAMAGERYERIHLFEMPAPRLLALWMPGMSGWQTAALRAIQSVRAWTGLRDRDLLEFLELTEQQIEIARLPFPECLSKAAAVSGAIRDPSRSPLAIPSGMGLDLPGILVGEAEKESRLRAVLVGLAVERYRVAKGGRLPENLGELIPEQLQAIPLDPFDGKPIRYKRLARGYVTYGIGKDNTDNGGQEYTGFARRPMDVTFTVER